MLSETLRREIAALGLAPDRPLLAVDADEVLVHFASHFAEFLGPLGFRLDLADHRPDRAIRERATGARAGRAQAGALIEAFFAGETRRQRAIAGAAEGLARLVRDEVQVVVLTNVPRFAREARAANLAGLGMPYPVLANEGGKGRALAELARRVPAGLAFVDDSPAQIGSAARHARTTFRVHFVGCPVVRAVTPPVPEAQAAPADWGALADLLQDRFGGGPGFRPGSTAK